MSVFEHDFLISYAHLDDEALIEGEPGWVSRLHKLLEIRVGQLLGEKPKIWRDPKLQGNDYFADTILERLPKIGALVSVVSPRYVQSEWCTRELKEFCRASEKAGGLRIADKARVFKVVKTPVPPERYPEEIQPLLGYEFYVVDPQSGRPRELFQAYGADAERAFLTKLDDLAYDISRLLEMLRTNGGPKPAESKGTVYLAETSFDLRDEREAIKRELVHNGYQVLPDQPLPLVASELNAVVRGQLARATLSVHLIGFNYGVVPEGATRSLVALQQELAAERSAAGGLARLLWMPPDLQVEDERQRELVEYLQTSPGVHAGAELLQIPLEDLKAAVHLKLTPPAPAKSGGEVKKAAQQVTHVYLICDQQDLEASRPLEDFLFDQGFEVTLPLFDEDEAQARIDHEESLCSCDAVLLFYGEAGEPWLRRKLRELQKSAGLGRDKPLLARGIYVAAPVTPQKERLRTLEAMVLREPGAGFSAAAIAPFLAEIAASRGPQ